MSKKRLSDEKIVAILEGIFKDNKPNTQVALEVLGKKTKESSVRHIKRTYEKHGNYFGITVETAEVEDQDWKIPEDTLEVLCEHPDWNLSNLAKRLRTAQRTNNQLRKIQRETFDSEGDVEYDFASVMQDVVKGLVDVKYEVPTASKEPRNPRTVEVIFSDLQIAKVTENYNTEVAIRALEYYGKEVLKKVQQVNPERIVFAALGDNCEGE
ncbi:exonuclease [Vibrio phage F94]